MNKNSSGSQRRSGGAAVEPLAVGPRAACILADVGMTRLYQLLNAGELDSYWEGRHRKITIESVHRRQQRLITEAQQGIEVKARKKGANSSAPADDISSPQARGSAMPFKVETIAPAGDRPADVDVVGSSNTTGTSGSDILDTQEEAAAFELKAVAGPGGDR